MHVPLNREIKKKLKSSHRQTQELVFKSNYSRVMKICLRYCKDKHEAEELLNDTFLKVFSKIGQYDENYNLEKWINRIAINSCIDKYRKSINEIDFLSISEISENLLKNQGKSKDHSMGDEVLNAVQSIPDSYRLIFNMFVFEGYTHHEIAEKLSIPVGTSKSAVARARKYLKKKLVQKKLLYEIRS